MELGPEAGVGVEVAAGEGAETGARTQSPSSAGVGVDTRTGSRSKSFEILYPESNPSNLIGL